MAMKPPKRIDLDPEKMESFLKRVKDRSLTDEDYEVIKGMAETISFLSRIVQHKKQSIGHLVRLLFGSPTEKLKNILKKKDGGDSDTSPPPASSGGVSPDTEGTKRTGHGRNGAYKYTGAEKVLIRHAQVTSGDRCPECQRGKVYDTVEPGVIVRFTGRAPVEATMYQVEKLRCNLCGKIFTAGLPEKAMGKKYDEKASSIIPLLKYGCGFPFHRMAQLQESVGIPLPASTQWEIVKETASRIQPVYTELIRQAAQGDILHNDDTTMKILALVKEESDHDNPSRKGVFTTGILSVLKGVTIALFFTGQKHAGENINDLLRKRGPDLPPPVQMCDALSRNIPEEFLTILAHCLTHGRRQFVDLVNDFPEESHHVIKILAQVYYHDAVAKAQGMSDKERLVFHQEQSGPLMEQLKIWLNEQIDEKKVEPNSGMGKAIAYMLRHWEPLTLFLRVEKAPLDNNVCERALKLAIQHRKNAYFYKTANGAHVGDLFMSIIHTCRLNNVNPFDYLVTLQKNCQDVLKNPHRWLPWNYKSMAAYANTS